ncbi:MAG: hypothetical protein N3A58_04155 [Spirochaetes bacterium]|nr:hypothetical protein [Spirochaetota bacterium]
MRLFSFYIFGATGSVGTMFFDVISKIKSPHNNNIKFKLLSCSKNVEKLMNLINKYCPESVYISDVSIEDIEKLEKDKSLLKVFSEHYDSCFLKNEIEYIDFLLDENYFFLKKYEDIYKSYFKKNIYNKSNLIKKNKDILFFLDIKKRFEILDEIIYKKNEKIEDKIDRNFQEKNNLSLDNKAENFIYFNSIMGYKGIIPAVINFLFNNIIGASANKESMIILGELLNNINLNIKLSDFIFPLDSEHFSLYKLLKILSKEDDLKNVIITASGGIFYEKLKNNFNFENLSEIKVDELLNHPNWRMGKRITIDSSTGLNKCFEFIEAIYLFNIEKEKIKIGVSKSSFIHGAVVDKTESIYIDASHPDMHQSINYFIKNILKIDTDYEYKKLQNYFIDYKIEEYSYDFFKITDFITKNYDSKNFMGTKLIILNEIMQDKLFKNEINLYQFIEKFLYYLKVAIKIDIFEKSFLNDFNDIINNFYNKDFSLNFEVRSKIKNWLKNLIDNFDCFKNKLIKIIV